MKRLEVAVEEARMNDLRFRGQQRRNLGAELAGEQLGKQHLVGGRLRCQRLHRQIEVAPGILAPGVILVDAGIGRHVLHLAEHVFGRRHVVHGGVRVDAEHVFARLLLEDARRAAHVENGELLQLLRHRHDRQAIARRHVAEHDVDLVALHEVAILRHLLGGRAGLVDVFDLELGAAEPDLVVGRRELAGVEVLDQDLGRVAPGNSERRRRRAGQECHDADLDGGGRRRRRLLGGRRDRRGERRQAGEPERVASGFDIAMGHACSPSSNIGARSERPLLDLKQTRSRPQIQPVFPGCAMIR